MNSKIIKDHGGKVAGFSGAGGIGLASIYFIFNQLVADLPTKADLKDYEIERVKALNKAEIRFLTKLNQVERNLSDYASAQIQEQAKMSNTLEEHIVKFNNWRKSVKKEF